MATPSTTILQRPLSSAVSNDQWLNDIHSQFPILSEEVNGHPLIYLDNAATTQKPQCVIDQMAWYYEEDNANIKRGMHGLTEKATDAYEGARKRVQEFVNAKHAREIIFTKNTTEGINLVARSWAEKNLKKGDKILLSLLEHHSNIVPWLQLKEKLGIEIDWIELNDDGTLNTEDANQKLTTKNYKLLSLTCVSNVLGTITPYKELTKIAHEHGAKVLLDASQLAAHSPIDVQQIDCDFLVFSGHKVYGPTGIGVLYGKEELLNAMPPFLGGGGMVQEVHQDGFTTAEPPDKFEAGTPPIAEAVGLHTALDWITEIDLEKIHSHEQELLSYAYKKLSALSFVNILSPEPKPEPDLALASCISFTTPPVHPHDLTDYLGKKGICLRAGHHCCQPLHDHLGVNATTRISVAVYNTKEEIESMIKKMEEAYHFFTKAG